MQPGHRTAVPADAVTREGRPPDTAIPPILQVNGVTHAFGSFRALDDVSVAVRANEIVALLGPSGCGKSTLLRTIAGFVHQTRGDILIGGRAVDRLPPGKRNIGIVFQNYALFPHLSVVENVAYGLKARGVSRQEIAPRTRAALETVRMTAFTDRMPRQLSGGQQQRVALARALVTEPTLILLDEPFAALDKNLRLEMQAEVKRLQRDRGLTAILVTHDQDEAMSVADRIAVMHHGRVEQIDSPAHVYDRPATLFVNGFVGATNLLAGRVADRSAGRCAVDLDVGATLSVAERHHLPVGRRVVVSVRPEHLMLFPSPAPGRWPVELRARTVIGGTLREELRAGDGTDLVRVTARMPDGAAPVQPGPFFCGMRDADCANLFPID